MPFEDHNHADVQAFIQQLCDFKY